MSFRIDDRSILHASLPDNIPSMAETLRTTCGPSKANERGRGSRTNLLVSVVLDGALADRMSDASILQCLGTWQASGTHARDRCRRSIDPPIIACLHVGTFLRCVRQRTERAAV
ncbi:MAG: hypothetical protein WB784_07690 [Rhodanobacteraceae bacterium]